MTAFALRIAGVDVILDVPSQVADDMRPEWGGFLTPSMGDAPIRLNTHRLSEDADPSRVFELPVSLGCTPDTLHIAQADIFDLRLDLRSLQGLIAYRHLEQVDRANHGPAGVRGALAVLWSILLPRRGGVLLHAGAVRVGHRGVAFVGPSGAGKSTIAGMFPRQDVLSDELVAITDLDSSPQVHATPFSGTLSGRRFRHSHPLSAAFQLRQSEWVGVLPLPRSEVFRLVARCIAIPAGESDLEQVLLDAAAKLSERIGWWTLQYSREPARVRRCVREVLTAV